MPSLLRNAAFWLVRPLDRGGMASVYLGEVTQGAQLCVVKELRRSSNRQVQAPNVAFYGDAILDGQVTDEARVLGRLRREHAAIPRYLGARCKRSRGVRWPCVSARALI